MKEFQLACLRDPRLSAHALSRNPVWLWSADASRLLWANAVGAAILPPMSTATRGWDAGERAQIGRLATLLPEDSGARLEKLRGFGADPGRMLSCACSRIKIADIPAILVVALEHVGPDLPFEERARALIAGSDMPVALFSTAGRLLHAEPDAQL